MEPTRGSFLRQSGLTSVAAGAAIATGLVLDVAIAARFGAGRVSDSFFVAARLPLGLVAVVMVGANQALVPAFSHALVRSSEKAFGLVSRVLAWTLLGGAALMALVSVLARPLIVLTAPGLKPEQVDLAVATTRIVFLVVPLVAAAEVLRAFLNARFAFVAPAAMNVVMNGVAASIVLAVPGRHIATIAWAYVAGAAAQLGFMAAMAARKGLRPQLSGMTEREVVEIGRLTTRPLLGAALNPLARIGEQVVVSFLPPGSITVLNYGYRLISAIGGSVFFRSVIVALVPRLTEATARSDDEEVTAISALGVRVMVALSFPLTAVLAVLASPMALLVFRRGSFSRSNTALLGAVLAVYAASLVGSAVQRALLAPFFSRLDTRTPLRNTFYGVLANLTLVPLVWVFPRSHAVLGIAVAYSVAQYVHVGHAWYRLQRSTSIRLPNLSRFLLGQALASAAGALVMLGGRLWLLEGRELSRPMLAVRLGVVGGAGAAVIGAIVGGMLRADLRRVKARRWRGKKVAPSAVAVALQVDAQGDVEER